MLFFASKSHVPSFTGMRSFSRLQTNFFFFFSTHSRIAKNSLSLRERFDVAAQIPDIYNHYYGRIAWRFEPFQASLIHLRQGFEAGLSFGHAEMGFHCLVHLIKLAIVSGINLKSILKDIDYYLQLLKTYKSATSTYILYFRETVSLYIDKGEATSKREKAFVEDLNEGNKSMREDVLFYHKAIRAFWSGYTDQCQYYSEKFMSLSLDEVRLNKHQVEFYHGKGSDQVIVFIWFATTYF